MTETPKPLSILMIGAHPDDCELKGAGTAIHWAAAGHRVQFVAMTGGDNGHPSMSGGALQQRRREEAAEAARHLGIERSVVLDNHGGELIPSLELRKEVVRVIREARADIVISHRSTDYHPDHRYTAILVQDAAYMVTVPFFVSSVPALERNPVFLYFEDAFTRPAPFRPDIAVNIDDVFDRKLDALEAHASQMFEWMPFMLSRTNGKIEIVPESPHKKRAWLAQVWFPESPSIAVQETLTKQNKANITCKHAEAFEVCEYGHQPNAEDLGRLFSFLKLRT